MATFSLHRELGVPSSTPVDFDLLSKLVEKGIREQSDLDFKQTLYHPKNEKDKQELIKDVCAMANTGGGWIICGITEKDSAAHEITGVTLEKTTETDIHQLLERRIEPSLTVDIRVYTHENEDKTLVTIRVPDSSNKPHLMHTAYSKDTKAFQVPVRKGSSTVWLNERGLRDLYRVRFDLGAEQERKRTQLLDELISKAKEEFPGISLALILIPDTPLVGRLEKEVAQQFLRQIELERFASLQGYSFLGNVHYHLSIGDRRYIGTQKSNRLHAFIEVGFDGSIGIVIQLSKDDPDIPDELMYLYTNQRDETTQKEVEKAIIEAFNCASQLSCFLNPVSDTEIQLYLVSCNDEPIVIRKNEGSWSGSLLRPRVESKAIKQFRSITYQLQASPSVAEQHEVLTDLVLDTLNQGGIETLRVLKSLEKLK